MTDFVVLGTGTMGTAMSYLLASNDHEVLMWTRRKDVADTINHERVNFDYMPNMTIPENASATTDLKKCIESANNIVLAIPSHGIHELFVKISNHKSSNKRWLSVIKGMDINFRRTVSQQLRHQLQVKQDAIAVLSGPDFAVEIVENVPTIAVIGAESKRTALLFHEALATEHFLIEVTDDSRGVEIGGILKNVGAIAIGLIDGLNLGDNTRGLIFSRYTHEALQIGAKIFKARKETLLGPACLGDMIATAFSYKSRNRIIGLLASKCITGIPKQTFIAEGKGNVGIIKELAHEHGINVPITDFVDSVLAGTKPHNAFNNLWKKLKKETTKK